MENAISHILSQCYVNKYTKGIVLTHVHLTLITQASLCLSPSASELSKSLFAIKLRWRESCTWNNKLSIGRVLSI